MKILAFDTSGDILSVGLYEGRKVLAEAESSGFSRHSAVLLPSIERMARSAGLKLKDLDVIAVGLGPGSFTGLRAGVTTAKILSFALNKKIVGVSSLEILAAAQSGQGPIAVLLDAKKNKTYTAAYDLKKDGSIVVLKKPALEKLDVFLKKIPRNTRVLALLPIAEASGRLLEARGCRQILDPQRLQARDLARLGLILADKKKFTKAEDLKPLYLHPRDCNAAPPPI